MGDDAVENDHEQNDDNAQQPELKRSQTLAQLYTGKWNQNNFVFRFFPTHDVMKAAWCGKDNLEFWGMQTWPAPRATFQLAHTAVWRGDLGERPKSNVTKKTFGSDKNRVAERSKYGSYYTWQLAMDVRNKLIEEDDDLAEFATYDYCPPYVDFFPIAGEQMSTNQTRRVRAEYSNIKRYNTDSKLPTDVDPAAKTYTTLMAKDVNQLKKMMDEENKEILYKDQYIKVLTPDKDDAKDLKGRYERLRHFEARKERRVTNEPLHDVVKKSGGGRAAPPEQGSSAESSAARPPPLDIVEELMLLRKRKEGADGGDVIQRPLLVEECVERWAALVVPFLHDRVENQTLDPTVLSNPFRGNGTDEFSKLFDRETPKDKVYGPYPLMPYGMFSESCLCAAPTQPYTLWTTDRSPLRRLDLLVDGPESKQFDNGMVRDGNYTDPAPRRTAVQEIDSWHEGAKDKLEALVKALRYDLYTDKMLVLANAEKEKLSNSLPDIEGGSELLAALEDPNDASVIPDWNEGSMKLLKQLMTAHEALDAAKSTAAQSSKPDAETEDQATPDASEDAEVGVAQERVEKFYRDQSLRFYVCHKYVLRHNEALDHSRAAMPQSFWLNWLLRYDLPRRAKIKPGVIAFPYASSGMVTEVPEAPGPTPPNPFTEYSGASASLQEELMKALTVDERRRVFARHWASAVSLACKTWNDQDERRIFALKFGYKEYCKTSGGTYTQLGNNVRFWDGNPTSTSYAETRYVYKETRGAANYNEPSPHWMFEDTWKLLRDRDEHRRMTYELWTVKKYKEDYEAHTNAESARDKHLRLFSKWSSGFNPEFVEKFRRSKAATSDKEKTDAESELYDMVLKQGFSAEEDLMKDKSSIAELRARFADAPMRTIVDHLWCDLQLLRDMAHDQHVSPDDAPSSEKSAESYAFYSTKEIGGSKMHYIFTTLEMDAIEYFRMDEEVSQSHAFVSSAVVAKCLTARAAIRPPDQGAEEMPVGLANRYRYHLHKKALEKAKKIEELYTAHFSISETLGTPTSEASVARGAPEDAEGAEGRDAEALADAHQAAYAPEEDRDNMAVDTVNAHQVLQEVVVGEGAEDVEWNLGLVAKIGAPKKRKVTGVTIPPLTEEKKEDARARLAAIEGADEPFLALQLRNAYQKVMDIVGQTKEAHDAVTRVDADAVRARTTKRTASAVTRDDAEVVRVKTPRRTTAKTELEKAAPKRKSQTSLADGSKKKRIYEVTDKPETDDVLQEDVFDEEDAGTVKRLQQIKNEALNDSVKDGALRRRIFDVVDFDRMFKTIKRRYDSEDVNFADALFVESIVSAAQLDVIYELVVRLHALTKKNEVANWTDLVSLQTAKDADDQEAIQKIMGQGETYAKQAKSTHTTINAYLVPVREAYLRRNVIRMARKLSAHVERLYENVFHMVERTLSSEEVAMRIGTLQDGDFKSANLLADSYMGEITKVVSKSKEYAVADRSDGELVKLAYKPFEEAKKTLVSREPTSKKLADVAAAMALRIELMREDVKGFMLLWGIAYAELEPKIQLVPFMESIEGIDRFEHAGGDMSWQKRIGFLSDLTDKGGLEIYRLRAVAEQLEVDVDSDEGVIRVQEMIIAKKAELSDAASSGNNKKIEENLNTLLDIRAIALMETGFVRLMNAITKYDYVVIDTEDNERRLGETSMFARGFHIKQAIAALKKPEKDFNAANDALEKLKDDLEALTSAQGGASSSSSSSSSSAPAVQSKVQELTGKIAVAKAKVAEAAQQKSEALPKLHRLTFLHNVARAAKDILRAHSNAILEAVANLDGHKKDRRWSFQEVVIRAERVVELIALGRSNADASRQTQRKKAANDEEAQKTFISSDHKKTKGDAQLKLKIDPSGSYNTSVENRPKSFEDCGFLDKEGMRSLFEPEFQKANPKLELDLDEPLNYEVMSPRGFLEVFGSSNMKKIVYGDVQKVEGFADNCGYKEYLADMARHQYFRHVAYFSARGKKKDPAGATRWTSFEIMKDVSDLPMWNARVERPTDKIGAIDEASVSLTESYWPRRPYNPNHMLKFVFRRNLRAFVRARTKLVAALRFWADFAELDEEQLQSSADGSMADDSMAEPGSVKIVETTKDLAFHWSHTWNNTWLSGHPLHGELATKYTFDTLFLSTRRESIAFHDPQGQGIFRELRYLWAPNRAKFEDFRAKGGVSYVKEAASGTRWTRIDHIGDNTPKDYTKISHPILESALTNSENKKHKLTRLEWEACGYSDLTLKTCVRANGFWYRPMDVVSDIVMTLADDLDMMGQSQKLIALAGVKDLTLYNANSIDGSLQKRVRDYHSWQKAESNATAMPYEANRDWVVERLDVEKELRGAKKEVVHKIAQELDKYRDDLVKYVKHKAALQKLRPDLYGGYSYDVNAINDADPSVATKSDIAVWQMRTLDTLRHRAQGYVTDGEFYNPKVSLPSAGTGADFLNDVLNVNGPNRPYRQMYFDPYSDSRKEGSSFLGRKTLFETTREFEDKLGAPHPLDVLSKTYLDLGLIFSGQKTEQTLSAMFQLECDLYPFETITKIAKALEFVARSESQEIGKKLRSTLGEAMDTYKHLIEAATKNDGGEALTEELSRQGFDTGSDSTEASSSSEPMAIVNMIKRTFGYVRTLGSTVVDNLQAVEAIRSLLTKLASYGFDAVDDTKTDPTYVDTNDVDEEDNGEVNERAYMEVSKRTDFKQKLLELKVDPDNRQDPLEISSVNSVKLFRRFHYEHREYEGVLMMYGKCDPYRQNPLCILKKRKKQLKDTSREQKHRQRYQILPRLRAGVNKILTDTQNPRYMMWNERMNAQKQARNARQVDSADKSTEQVEKDAKAGERLNFAVRRSLLDKMAGSTNEKETATLRAVRMQLETQASKELSNEASSSFLRKSTKAKWDQVDAYAVDAAIEYRVAHEEALESFVGMVNSKKEASESGSSGSSGVIAMEIEDGKGHEQLASTEASIGAGQSRSIFAEGSQLKVSRIWDPSWAKDPVQQLTSRLNRDQAREPWKVLHAAAVTEVTKRPNAPSRSMSNLKNKVPQHLRKMPIFVEQLSKKQMAHLFWPVQYLFDAQTLRNELTVKDEELSEELEESYVDTDETLKGIVGKLTQGGDDEQQLKTFDDEEFGAGVFGHEPFVPKLTHVLHGGDRLLLDHASEGDMDAFEKLVGRVVSRNIAIGAPTLSFTKKSETRWYQSFPSALPDEQGARADAAKDNKTADYTMRRASPEEVEAYNSINRAITRLGKRILEVSDANKKLEKVNKQTEETTSALSAATAVHEEKVTERERVKTSLDEKLQQIIDALAFPSGQLKNAQQDSEESKRLSDRLSAVTEDVENQALYVAELKEKTAELREQKDRYSEVIGEERVDQLVAQKNRLDNALKTMKKNMPYLSVLATQPLGFNGPYALRLLEQHVQSLQYTHDLSLYLNADAKYADVSTAIDPEPPNLPAGPGEACQLFVEVVAQLVLESASIYFLTEWHLHENPSTPNNEIEAFRQFMCGADGLRLFANDSAHGKFDPDHGRRAARLLHAARAAHAVGFVASKWPSNDTQAAVAAPSSSSQRPAMSAAESVFATLNLNPYAMSEMLHEQARDWVGIEHYLNGYMSATGAGFVVGKYLCGAWLSITALKPGGAGFSKLAELAVEKEEVDRETMEKLQKQDKDAAAAAAPSFYRSSLDAYNYVMNPPPDRSDKQKTSVTVREFAQKWCRDRASAVRSARRLLPSFQNLLQHRNAALTARRIELSAKLAHYADSDKKAYQRSKSAISYIDWCGLPSQWTLDAVQLLDAENNVLPFQMFASQPVYLPLRISAPPRVGKSVLTLLMITLARRIGFVCTYSVAPDKTVPLEEAVHKLVDIHWTSYQDFIDEEKSRIDEVLQQLRARGVGGSSTRSGGLDVCKNKLLIASGLFGPMDSLSSDEDKKILKKIPVVDWRIFTIKSKEGGNHADEGALFGGEGDFGLPRIYPHPRGLKGAQHGVMPEWWNMVFTEEDKAQKLAPTGSVISAKGKEQPSLEVPIVRSQTQDAQPLTSCDVIYYSHDEDADLATVSAILNQSRAMTPTLFANFHDECQTMAKVASNQKHKAHEYYAPEPPALHYLRSTYSNLIGPQVLVSATLFPTFVEPLWGFVGSVPQKAAVGIRASATLTELENEAGARFLPKIPGAIAAPIPKGYVGALKMNSPDALHVKKVFQGRGSAELAAELATRESVRRRSYLVPFSVAGVEKVLKTSKGSKLSAQYETLMSKGARNWTNYEAEIANDRIIEESIKQRTHAAQITFMDLSGRLEMADVPADDKTVDDAEANARREAEAVKARQIIQKAIDGKVEELSKLKTDLQAVRTRIQDKERLQKLKTSIGLMERYRTDKLEAQDAYTAALNKLKEKTSKAAERVGDMDTMVENLDRKKDKEKIDAALHEAVASFTKMLKLVEDVVRMDLPISVPARSSAAPVVPDVMQIVARDVFGMKLREQVVRTTRKTAASQRTERSNKMTTLTEEQFALEEKAKAKGVVEKTAEPSDISHAELSEIPHRPGRDEKILERVNSYFERQREQADEPYRWTTPYYVSGDDRLKLRTNAESKESGSRTEAVVAWRKQRLEEIRWLDIVTASMNSVWEPVVSRYNERSQRGAVLIEQDRLRKKAVKSLIEARNNGKHKKDSRTGPADEDEYAGYSEAVQDSVERMEMSQGAMPMTNLMMLEQQDSVNANSARGGPTLRASTNKATAQSREAYMWLNEDNLADNDGYNDNDWDPDDAYGPSDSNAKLHTGYSVVQKIDEGLLAIENQQTLTEHFEDWLQQAPTPITDLWGDKESSLEERMAAWQNAHVDVRDKVSPLTQVVPMYMGALSEQIVNSGLASYAQYFARLAHKRMLDIELVERREKPFEPTEDERAFMEQSAPGSASASASAIKKRSPERRSARRDAIRALAVSGDTAAFSTDGPVKKARDPSDEFLRHKYGVTFSFFTGVLSNHTHLLQSTGFRVYVNEQKWRERIKDDIKKTLDNFGLSVTQDGSGTVSGTMLNPGAEYRMMLGNKKPDEGNARTALVDWIQLAIFSRDRNILSDKDHHQLWTTIKTEFELPFDQGGIEVVLGSGDFARINSLDKLVHWLCVQCFQAFWQPDQGQSVEKAAYIEKQKKHWLNRHYLLHGDEYYAYDVDVYKQNGVQHRIFPNAKHSSLQNEKVSRDLDDFFYVWGNDKMRVRGKDLIVPSNGSNSEKGVEKAATAWTHIVTAELGEIARLRKTGVGAQEEPPVFVMGLVHLLKCLFLNYKRCFMLGSQSTFDQDNTLGRRIFSYAPSDIVESTEKLRDRKARTQDRSNHPCVVLVYDPARPENKADLKNRLAKGQLVETQPISANLPVLSAVATKNAKHATYFSMYQPFFDETNVGFNKEMGIAGPQGAETKSDAQQKRSSYGIHRIAVLGYAMLRAGLTLQWVTKTSMNQKTDTTTLQDDLRAASEEHKERLQRRLDERRARLIFAPRWVSMFSSDMGKIDQRLQMAGRAFVDLKENRAPPNWTIVFLSIKDMLEAIVRYQEIEIRLADMPGETKSVVRALHDAFKALSKISITDDRDKEVYETNNIDHKIAKKARLGAVNVRLGNLLGYTEASVVSMVDSTMAERARVRRVAEEERQQDERADMALNDVNNALRFTSDYYRRMREAQDELSEAERLQADQEEEEQEKQDDAAEDQQEQTIQDALEAQQDRKETEAAEAAAKAATEEAAAEEAAAEEADDEEADDDQDNQAEPPATKEPAPTSDEWDVMDF